MKKIIPLVLSLSICSQIHILSAQLDMIHPIDQMYMKDVQNKHTMMHDRGMYGNYPMTREASGTSWLPDSTPMEAFHFKHNDWSFMLHGYNYTIYDDQRGNRGDKGALAENMLMFTGQENLEKATIAFRTMFCIEPLTIGACGYPLLFQTGETCDGITPLIDRQHPHDMIMELSLVYTYLLQNNSSLFFYFGLPGEPALGPTVFMMRFSGEYIPEAPLGHHWTDSTHITFGVATFGYVLEKNIKFEFSIFTGREPDQHRYSFDKPKFDSYSVRFSWNPQPDWALQGSYGFLKSPEQLEPEVNEQRLTLSAFYNKNFGCHTNFQGAAIFGLKRNKPGKTLPAIILEGTYEYKRKHLVFGRFESQVNDELFEKPSPFVGKKFTVNKFTIGYILEKVAPKHIKWGFGGLVDFPVISSTLKEVYGKTVSFMLFFQVRIV